MRSAGISMWRRTSCRVHWPTDPQPSMRMRPLKGVRLAWWDRCSRSPGKLAYSSDFRPLEYSHSRARCGSQGAPARDATARDGRYAARRTGLRHHLKERGHGRCLVDTLRAGDRLLYPVGRGCLQEGEEQEEVGRRPIRCDGLRSFEPWYEEGTAADGPTTTRAQTWSTTLTPVSIPDRGTAPLRPRRHLSRGGRHSTRGRSP